jgi:hypothetical protein
MGSKHPFPHKSLKFQWTIYSSDEEDFASARAALEGSRYLVRPHRYAAQHNSTELRALLHQRRDFFRHQTRMCQETFLRLLDLIADNPLFHNDSMHEQRHPGIQLYVYLQVMGHDGNGLANVAISGALQIGEGTVSLYVKRAGNAIRLLRTRFVRWPNAISRQTMAARFFRSFGFYAFGILDGTFVYFNQAPSVDPHNFFTRKRKMYGLNCQLVCNLDWKIIGYVLGWPGCTPDTQAFETSKFFLNSSKYFSPGEFILADKGYTPRITICVPYDEPECVDTDDSSEEQKRLYNDGLKKGRLLIERVNAMLKNRFTWLKGMRCPVRCKEDFERVNNCIEAIIVLHNFMMSVSVNDVWTDVRRPACDAWESELHKYQARAACATAKANAALHSTQRAIELLSRSERMAQFILWRDIGQYMN